MAHGGLHCASMRLVEGWMISAIGRLSNKIRIYCTLACLLIPPPARSPAIVKIMGWL